MKTNLKDKLSNSFFKIVILPMVLASVSMIVLLIIIRLYLFTKIESFEVNKANNILEIALVNEQKMIMNRFSDIESLAVILQKEHEQIFKYKDIRDKKVDFSVAKNGAYYKTTHNGSILYYSSTTKIGKEEKEKALFTENMDTTFKTIVDNNELVVAAYFNSYDNMNRLYPYVDKVYEQYGSTLVMQDYNFYYLADEKHNPTKKPVWTEAYLDPAGNGWMISCVVPIYSGDFLEGVTGIDITLETMIKTILDKQLPYDAKMILVSKSGIITAMPDDIVNLTGVKELEKHNYTEPIKNTIKKPQEFNIFKSENKFLHEISKMIQKSINTKEIAIDSGRYVVFHKRLKDGSALVLYADKSMITEIVSYIMDTSCIAMLSLIVLFALILYLKYKNSLKYYNKLSTEIVEPIAILSKISADISTHSNFIVPKVEILEIDELSKNFMKMAKELDLKNTQLEELNNSLAVRVENATKELKEKNKLMNTLLNTTMEAVVIFNEEYKIVQKNQAAIDMFQFTAQDDLSIYNIYNFIPQEEQHKVQEALSKKEIIPYAINLYKKDKTIFPALIKGSDTIIGNKKHRISTIIDLTDIKQKEQQLLQQSKLASMGDMIGMIAHQWRQPLNAISSVSASLSLKNRLNILDKKVLDTKLNDINKYVQHLSSTITDFMNFFKPGKEKEFVDIKNIINSIKGIIFDSFNYHNIELIIDIEDGISPFLCYENELKQVILNLAKNSKDAIIANKVQNGFVNINIYKNDEFVSIDIEDNGGGIPEEIVDKVFEPYFTTKNNDGTGIGLYMSKIIIEEHLQGILKFENKNNGVVFTIQLRGAI